VIYIFIKKYFSVPLATPHFPFRVKLLCEKRNCVMVYFCGEISDQVGSGMKGTHN
jgi:hypothetical protein